LGGFMSLPFDVALCIGHIYDSLYNRPCFDCQRRTEAIYSELWTWITEPPPFINGVCAYRIAHEGEKK